MLGRGFAYFREVNMNYQETLKRLSPKLKAISKKVNRRYSYCDENDFYQEAILYLWTLYEKGETMDKTDSYILQGCYYFMKNYIRKLCKSIDNNSVSLYGNSAETGTLIEETIISEAYVTEIQSIDMYMLLCDTEKNFTNKEKDVFYYQLEGLTTREIGEKIGVSHVMVIKMEKKIREKCSKLKEELV